MKITRRFAVRNIEEQDHFTPLAVSPDGKLLAILRRDSRIDVFDVRTGYVVKQLSPPIDWREANAIAVAFSPDGTTLGVSYGGSSSFENESLAFFRLSDFRRIRIVEHHQGLVFDPRGTKVLSFGENSLDSIEVVSGIVTRLATAQRTYVNLFGAWSHDGSQIAAVVEDPMWKSPCPPNIPHTDACNNIDHQVIVVDVATRRVRKLIGGVHQWVSVAPLAFSRQDRILAPFGFATARYQLGDGAWWYVTDGEALAYSTDARWEVTPYCERAVLVQNPDRAAPIPYSGLGCRR